MKKLVIMVTMIIMTITANAMNYNKAKNEAMFLSDKMAYELNLTKVQYEAVYEINFDYYLSVDKYADTYGKWWIRRNNDLKYVLNYRQYDKYTDIKYFYRPISWKKDTWVFNIYEKYNKNKYYRTRPDGITNYRGGNNKKANNFYEDRFISNKKNTPRVNNGIKPGRISDVKKPETPSKNRGMVKPDNKRIHVIK